MKISDMISKNSTKRKISVLGEEIELSFSKFTMKHMVILEDDFGVDIRDFQTLMSEQPAKWATLFGWILLLDSDKEQFNSDVAVFRDSLSLDSLEELSVAIADSFENAMPKNAKAEKKKAK
jgi:hypothetical protein